MSLERNPGRPAAAEDGSAGALERGLFLGVLLLVALALPCATSFLRPGFARYDESSLLDQIQAWREGAPLMVGYGWSSLYRAVDLALVACAGPHLAVLHLVPYAAVLAEPILLFVWLRPRLGERAALWAALADLVCTATFQRGASLLGASVLPALFLLGALGVERCRRAWQAALLGLGLTLLLLDWEGWGAALLFLLPWAAWRWRGRRGWRLAAVVGAAAGAGLVLALSPGLAEHLRDRGSVSSTSLGAWRQVLANLAQLPVDHDRYTASAAAGHPWPAPWMWPLALAGALAAWRRFPWLAWLLAAGSLALALPRTAEEPHRLSLALLALSGAAGCGAAELWRRPWGGTLCVALLLFGCGDEAWAWAREPELKVEQTYGASRNLMAAVDFLQRHRPAGGWDVISGVGPAPDGDFRFLLDGAGVGARGAVPVALVDGDYLPGLAGLDLAAPSVPVSAGGGSAVVLVFPGPASARRLRAVAAGLAPLRRAQSSRPPGAVSDLAAAWLQDPAHRDPWARTAAWELWLTSSMLVRRVELGGIAQLLREPLVSGWALDCAAQQCAAERPGLARLLRRRAEAVDPRRLGLDEGQRAFRY